MGAVNIFADGLGIGTGDSQAIDLAGHGIVQEITHVFILKKLYC